MGRTIAVDFNQLDHDGVIPVLVWQLPNATPAERVRVIDTDGELAAWGYAEPRGSYVNIHVARSTIVQVA